MYANIMVCVCQTQLKKLLTYLLVCNKEHYYLPSALVTIAFMEK